MTDPAALFEYDPGAPLNVQLESVELLDGVRIEQLAYESPVGGRVPATLVTPAGSAPMPGIVLGHGRTPAGRRSILPYGLDLARTGAVVLAIDAPYVRRGAPMASFTRQDRDDQVQLILDLRRGIDLLTGRPEVDPGRLAYIGHSHGAAIGGLLAGVERRLSAFVLAAGDGGLVSHFTGEGPDAEELLRLSSEAREDWLAAMVPIEPLRFIGSATPAKLLFQAGRRDQLIPIRDVITYYEAASHPKEIRWYDAGHLLDERALLDQVEWLAGRIGLEPGRFAFRHGCRRISCHVDRAADV